MGRVHQRLLLDKHWREIQPRYEQLGSDKHLQFARGARWAHRNLDRQRHDHLGWVQRRLLLFEHGRQIQSYHQQLDAYGNSPKFCGGATRSHSGVDRQ